MDARTPIPVLEDNDERCDRLGIAAGELRGRAPEMVRDRIIKARDAKILMKRGQLAGVGGEDAAEIHDEIQTLLTDAESLIDYTKLSYAAAQRVPFPSQERKDEKQRVGAGLQSLVARLQLGAMGERILRPAGKSSTPRPRPAAIEVTRLPVVLVSATPKRAPWDYADFGFEEILRDLRAGERLGEIAQEMKDKPYMAEVIIDPLLRRVAYTADGSYDSILSNVIFANSDVFNVTNVAGFTLLSDIYARSSLRRQDTVGDFTRHILIQRHDLTRDVGHLVTIGRGAINDALENRGHGDTEESLMAAAERATGINLFQWEPQPQPKPSRDPGFWRHAAE